MGNFIKGIFGVAKGLGPMLWVYGGIAVVVLGLIAGHFLQVAHLQHKYDREHSAYTEYQAKVAKADRAAEAAARAKEKKWADDFAALQAQYTQEAKDDEVVIGKLRNALADGTLKLRIAGICPGGFGGTGTIASTPIGGNGTTVELSPAAARLAVDLKAALLKDQRTIRACQATLRSERGQ